MAQENNNNAHPCPYQKTLSKIIFDGNLKLFHQLLAYNEDCGYKDTFNRTPLHIALLHVADEDMATTLLARNIDFDTADSEGNTVLHYVISTKKSSEFLTKLLDLKKIALESCNAQGRTALHEALLRENMEALTLLQRYGASINYIDKDGLTPLFKAIGTNNQKLFKTLIGCPDSLSYQDTYKRTALHYALLLSQDEQLICDLVNAYPAAADIQDHDGKIPLHWVMIQKRSGKLLQLLLEKTKDLTNEDNAGHGPIHKAVMHNFIPGIEALTKHGVSANWQTSKGLTPLLLTFDATGGGFMGRGNADLIKPLVLCGANPNEEDDAGNRPLHKAVEANLVDHAKQLILSGAVKNVKNKAGKTPLDLAVNKSCMLKVLEEF